MKHTKSNIKKIINTHKAQFSREKQYICRTKGVINKRDNR